MSATEKNRKQDADLLFGKRLRRDFMFNDNLLSLTLNVFFVGCYWYRIFFKPILIYRTS